MSILSPIVEYVKDSNVTVECENENKPKAILKEEEFIYEGKPQANVGDFISSDSKIKVECCEKNDSDVLFHDPCESFSRKEENENISVVEMGKDAIFDENENIKFLENIKNENDSSVSLTTAVEGIDTKQYDNMDTSSTSIRIEIPKGDENNECAKDQNGKSVYKRNKSIKVPTRLRKKLTVEKQHTELSKQLLYGITPEMIEEENKYKVEEQKQLEEIRLKAIAELQRTGKEKRFSRLQLLLSRSQMYSTYLLGRLNARREAEEKRMARMNIKQEELKKNAATESEDNPQGREKKHDVDDKMSSRGKRKRKVSEKESYKQNSKKQKVSAKKQKKKKSDSTDSGSEQQQNEEKDGSQKGIPQQDKNAKSDTNREAVDVQKLYYSRTINEEDVSPLQPLLVTGGVMRSYQIEGMTWLLGLFEHGINGILADEMGLGKTLQSIAMIVSLIERGVRGPFLIAAPLSTLPNWIAEFKKFAPELYSILYHGSIPERAQIRRKLMRIKRYSHGFSSLPVVISSYEILMRDRPVLDVYNIEWKFLIVDEGHRIKNLNCKLIHELKQYNTANRLLLTGTPLQNNLSELWSLLNFLLPDIFDDLRSFQEWFDFSALTEGEDTEDFVEKEKEGNVLKTLHSILTPFLLRRLKTDVDLTIPPKKEVYVYAPLTEKQEMFYKTTLDRTILDLITKKHKVDEPPKEFTMSGRAKRKTVCKVSYKEEEELEDIDFDALLIQMEENELRKKEELEERAKKEKPKSFVNIRLQNIMMQLRKCCNHPYLLEYPYNPDTDELKIDEDLVKVSGKMLMLDRMLPELKKRGHKVLIFSQMTIMLDIIGDYCSLREYSYSRIDGTMSIHDRQDSIANFSESEETFLFLLSTRAGGLGLNLMMADTCIIYDSDWNPQVDLQAQDRCHRIGQTKPVIIYRFVTANTIDQRIIERATAKRKLEKMIIHKKHFKGRTIANGISPTELLDLLESKDVESSHDTGSNIISDEDLNKLLDRSDMVDLNSMKKGFKIKDKEKGCVKIEEKENTPVKKGVFKVIGTVETDEINF